MFESGTLRLPNSWIALKASTVKFLLIGAFLATSPVMARAEIADAELLMSLRNGGLVVYFRHAATGYGADAPATLEGCGDERNLSLLGRRQARMINAAVTAIGAKIGIVLSSPTCRTRETALIAFGRTEPTPLLHSLIGASQGQPRVVETLRLFSTAPEEGTIRVMIAHQSNLRVPLGISLAEGESAILQPSPDGRSRPEVLARLMPQDWLRLAGASLE